MIEKKIQRFELTPDETLDLIGGYLHSTGRVKPEHVRVIFVQLRMGGGLIIEIEEVEG